MSLLFVALLGISCNILFFVTPDPPRIFGISPQNETKQEDHNMTFSCSLEGKPLARVTWMFNNTVIVPDSRKYIVQNQTLVTKDTASLTIIGLNRTDQGYYTCRAQNEIGIETSETSAFLKVLCKFTSRNCFHAIYAGVNNLRLGPGNGTQ